MAEEKPSLHIDTDWKKQAQEEKRRLAEEEAKKKQAAPPAQATPDTSGVTRSAGARSRPGRGELPPASIQTLIQSTMTQALFHLGDLATRGEQPSVNLDMAKHHVDTLAVLEEKTRGNLTEEERAALDTAMYESRMRYVAVATQFLGP